MNIRSLGKPLVVVIAALLGFTLTVSGIVKKADAESQLNVSLGKQESKLEVYLFSDWLCPFCSNVEDVMDAVYPALSQKAKVVFVDKIVHPEAMNFVPYDISFAVYEKPKYLQLRKALFALAKKTKNPSYEDVKAAIAPLKVTYRQLSFMEVTQQMASFQKMSDQFKVNSTPSMVVRNAKTNKFKLLVGNSQITRELIMKALKEVE